LTDSIDKFLEQISEEAILVAANSFDNSIKELRATSTVTDVLLTAASCQKMLAAVEASPSDPSTALLVVDVLKGFSRLEDYVDSQMVEVRMSRSLIMFSSWNLFYWADSIVQNSIKQKVISCWVDRLVSNVSEAVTNLAAGQPEFTFSSADYLATIDPPNEYFYRCNRYRHSWTPEAQIVEIYSVATAVIRQWIGLPEETIYLQRYTFLDTFLSMPHSPIAILYLDAVWDIYKNPSARLLRGTRKAGSKNPQQQFEGFKNRIQQHPISNQTSQTCQYLKHLYTRAEVWYSLRTSHSIQVSVKFLFQNLF
jgi:hypothetical protein